MSGSAVRIPGRGIVVSITIADAPGVFYIDSLAVQPQPARWQAVAEWGGNMGEAGILTAANSGGCAALSRASADASELIPWGGPP